MSVCLCVYSTPDPLALDSICFCNVVMQGYNRRGTKKEQARMEMESKNAVSVGNPFLRVFWGDLEDVVFFWCREFILKALQQKEKKPWKPMLDAG